MTDKIKCKYCKKSIRKWTVSLDFKRYDPRTCYRIVEKNNYYNFLINNLE